MTIDHTGRYYVRKCLMCGRETSWGEFCSRCSRTIRKTMGIKKLTEFNNIKKGD